MMAEAILLIGTRKGLVIARSGDDRRTWQVDPIAFVMQEVSAVAIDARRDTPRLFATGSSSHWGPALSYSDDLGRSWVEPEQAPIAFPESTGTALARVWQVQPGPASQPEVVYAGVEPAALFRSEDSGASFSLVEGLWDHPQRPEWNPGFGGLCLHTVIPHPTDTNRVHIAISSGGVYRTADGGDSWEPANRGIQSYWMPEDQRYPEFGQCVHKVSVHPDRPDRMYAQNHFGVYRSDDAADSWQSVDAELPDNFGFPVVVHPRRPDTLYVFPLVADGERMPAGGACRIYRSDDAGDSWRALSDGLPQQGYYAAVLRDALSVDSGDPAGVYFGTRVGEVYASRDEGESWQLVADHLPDVLSVRAAVLS